MNGYDPHTSPQPGFNRQQRRTMAKRAGDAKLEVANVIVNFTNGTYAVLDLTKVSIIDRDGKPLFETTQENTNAKD